MTLRMQYRRAVVFAATCAALLLFAGAAEALERRRDQFGGEFGYFVYPIASTIPGFGSTQGLGATVLNMFDSDADFTGFYVRGDFDASGYTVLDMSLLPRRLVLDVGYFDYRVAPVTYQRGIDSDPHRFILPEVEGAYGLAQLTLSFAERMAEFYVRHSEGRMRLLRVLDKDGSAFDAIDTSRRVTRLSTLGGSFDYTDDRLDPRVGIRLEVADKMPYIADTLRSDYFVMDYNITGYIPFRRWDTLALNAFLSNAHITRQASTDSAVLRAQTGLGCSRLPPGPAQGQCQATEDERIRELSAGNRYGMATSLGGTQRLRAFPNGRFYAGNALSYGAEYRLNLTDERVPFDYFIAKGIRTGFQLAFFAEQGSVADQPEHLLDRLRSSYGVGFRIVLAGVVIRADYAQGEEGPQFQLFINYPWSMFSVDSPG